MENKPENRTKEISYTRERLLKDLVALRNDFIDEIPSNSVITGETPDYDRYKCRTNWFNNISARIGLLKIRGITLSADTWKKCDDFMHFCQTIKGTKRPYQKEDIELGNNMLDALIKELS